MKGAKLRLEEEDLVTSADDNAMDETLMEADKTGNTEIRPATGGLLFFICRVSL